MTLRYWKHLRHIIVEIFLFSQVKKNYVKSYSSQFSSWGVGGSLWLGHCAADIEVLSFRRSHILPQKEPRKRMKINAKSNIFFPSISVRKGGIPSIEKYWRKKNCIVFWMFWDQQREALELTEGLTGQQQCGRKLKTSVISSPRKCAKYCQFDNKEMI